MATEQQPIMIIQSGTRNRMSLVAFPTFGNFTPPWRSYNAGYKWNRLTETERLAYYMKRLRRHERIQEKMIKAFMRQNGKQTRTTSKKESS